MSDFPHTAEPCPDCQRCLHEGVDAARAAFKRMFPYHWVQGIVVPNVGAPLTHLRAWTLQAGMKSEKLQRLVLDLASDLEDATATAQAAELASARAIATRLLHDLFPDARVHEPFVAFRLTRMSAFDEVMQVAEAAAELAQHLAEILHRCSGGSGDDGGVGLPPYPGSPYPVIDAGDDRR